MDIKKSLKDVVVLVAICAVFAVVLAAVNSITAPIIADRLAGAADEAYNAVIPGAEGFETVDLSQYTLPATVKEAKRETSGKGYGIKLETKGYGSGMILIVGVSNDGVVTGATCVTSNETNGAEKGYGDSFVGKDQAGSLAVDTIAGSTMTTQAYRAAVVDAINSAAIFGGASVDVRTEEEILSDNLDAVLPEANGEFTKLFIVEVLTGIDKVYTADNGAGYVIVIGDMFIGVGADGAATSVVDALTNPMTEDTDELKADAEAAVVILSASGELINVDITGFSGIDSHITSVKKTISGNYVFEIKAAGFGMQGLPPYIPAKNVYILMKVCISADGKIIDSQTISHEETTGYGDVKLEDGALNSEFIGKTDAECGNVDVNNGATVTSSAYKVAILNCFEAYTIITGGTN